MQSCMMAKKGEEFFSLAAHWIKTHSLRFNIPLSEWKIYVPYKRCIPFLGRFFFSQEKGMPNMLSVTQIDPIPFEKRLGWMLSFLTPVLSNISLEHRLTIAKDALSLWEQSLLYETSWHKLCDVQEELFSQYKCSALHLLRYISESWPEFLKKQVSFYKCSDEYDCLLSQPTILIGCHGTLPFTQNLMKRLKKSTQGWILFPYVPKPVGTLSSTHPFYGFQKTLSILEVSYESIAIISSLTVCKEQKNECDAQDAFLASYHGHCLSSPIKNNLEYYTVTTPLEEVHQVAQCLITYHKLGKSVLCVTPDPVLAEGVSIMLKNEKIPLYWKRTLTIIHNTGAHFILILWNCIHKKWSFFSSADFIKHNVLTTSYPVLFRWMNFLEDTYFRGNALPENFLEWLKRHGQHTRYPRIAERVNEIFYSHLHLISSMINSFELYPLTQWLHTLNDVLHGLLKDMFWKSCSGNEIKKALDTLKNNACAYAEMSGEDVGILLKHFFQNYCFFSQEEKDEIVPTLYICSPKEARLLVQHYDVCIMTSLYEGGWPRALTANSLLPVSLHEFLNFPPVTWQIGMSARNFYACLSAPKLILIRSKDRGDPSRFLLRLKGTLPFFLVEDFKYFSYYPCSFKKPSVVCSEIKPKSLSVNDMALLHSNPYGFYLKRILGIAPLPALQKNSGVSLGIAFHQLLAQWMRRCPSQGSLSEHTLRCHLMQLIEENLFSLYSNKIVRTQILRCCEEFLACELQKRKNFFTSFVKVKGCTEIMTAFGSVNFFGQADRIDCTSEKVVIVDYKTGALPKSIQTNELEHHVWWLSWMLKHNGFKGVPNSSCIHVQWLQLSLAHGLKCIESNVEQNLENDIQHRWNVLEDYILGKTPYVPLEVKNFTDGISRRLEWSPL
ncbi:hypothetical protein P618_201054 [Holospora obtusa F1]|uniref:PD-(D/E)XK endonuclease-like domain-containing protein n=1 Tax=Holospora obtusa F1 TaxID=1399147 RepID=W6TD17_HOLOB|nr:PD-(D/E)XK nuclease family protein [Holospora obtusa]ETZ06763.1 hypothetical protein P618_201054 [Holospora obtusa F1]